MTRIGTFLALIVGGVLTASCGAQFTASQRQAPVSDDGGMTSPSGGGPTGSPY